MELVSLIFLCVILFENVLAQPVQHVIPGDQVISTGQHIDVGDEDYHDGDDDVDYTDDVDDVDDSHGSPSQLLQGGYQRNQHYGGGNYHSGYYRPNKQHGNGYGGQYPKKYGSGYKH
uniref:Immunogenic miracidial antigen 8I' n=1 Tax=Schistosoma japonicum TaxID=6182 RepID=C7TV92_SCHJA|nr:Immunogenic miracidial antigen 8I' [Schistosoma japonicum]CAX81520.1 Immunogenic miracidial antigen 8I' [Schistosoma japonicum]CAX81634.1 Immunogenic miracidial antigen 8I' [Schistosoma japonicum]